MIRALKTAATGMAAQQLNVDNIANNLANINTTGFKRSKVEFQDLFYQTTRAPGGIARQGVERPTSLEVGYGAVPVATPRIFSQGELLPTSNPLDIAINGGGFLRVLMADGTYAYTRDGALKLSGDGRLVTTDGEVVDPEISIPEGTTEIMIARDGTVGVRIGSGRPHSRDTRARRQRGDLPGLPGDRQRGDRGRDGQHDRGPAGLRDKLQGHKDRRRHAGDRKQHREVGDESRQASDT
jgi:flagellar hook-basal body protein